MTAFFVSDIHLKAPDEPNARLFEAFLSRLQDSVAVGGAGKPTHLFLVGDIFDLWIGGHAFFRNRFEAIVDRIRQLVRAGVEVHYFEGNHDLHLHSFWAGEVGAFVHEGHADFDLADRRVRVEHGDLINPDDRGYLVLRWLLRTPPVRALALNLPSKTVRWIGERASRASRDYTSSAKELPQERIRALIRTHAERIFATEPIDWLVAGHVHVRDDQVFQVGGREVRSINLGSWFEEPRVLVLTEQGAEWRAL